jgi:nicotinamidase-related amidase
MVSEKPKSCLVIIDVQHVFINDNTKELPEKILDFVQRNNFDLIIGTRYINTPDSACYKLGNWKCSMEGSVESEIVPEIFDIVNGVFYKHIYSCYSEAMKWFLWHNQISRLYFCGISTECCVMSSVLNAYDDVADCFVIEDLCASTEGIDMHNAAIDIMKHCVGSDRVIRSTEIERT